MKLLAIRAAYKMANRLKARPQTNQQWLQMELLSTELLNLFLSLETEKR